MALLVTLGVCVALAAIVAVTLSQIYNRLVMLKNRCDNGFAQIEVQLKRRYDLIPNLVQAVKGYLVHERETLEGVIAARNQASVGLNNAMKDPGNIESMKAFIGSENQLAGALGRMNFLMEAYPELKANENVASLSEELSHTENRLAFSRQSYNDLIMSFNTYRQSLPTILFASTLGFDANREMLEFADSEQIQEVPQVSLV